MTPNTLKDEIAQSLIDLVGALRDAGYRGEYYATAPDTLRQAVDLLSRAPQEPAERPHDPAQHSPSLRRNTND